MGDLDDVVLAVCRMPLDQERSHVDAMERSGYLDHRGAITADDIYACLTPHPELVDAWQGWSDDIGRLPLGTSDRPAPAHSRWD